MKLPAHKTKIVCTIGPASEHPAVLGEMIRAGMNVARFNFSHGDFAWHGQVIENLRHTASAGAFRPAIMADLPGPKIRIGSVAEEPVELKPGEPFSLTTEEVPGGDRRVMVNFSRLPRVVKPGDTLFLSDGLIQLQVEGIEGNEVRSRVVVGGELRSHKGLNLPGIDLGISAFTDYDRRCLEFAREKAVDAVSQSFVESGKDVADLRRAAEELGYRPFIIAKIERSRALTRIDEILAAADGIMIARGDLGVEIPIERIAGVQKELTRKANRLGKPVITATQMLESMTANRRPTRAEATDVANAILDGTDCVMLSEESALGKFPVESVAMLAKISEAIEPYLSRPRIRNLEDPAGLANRLEVEDLITGSVESALQKDSLAGIVVPSRSGMTARRIARLRPPLWIAAVSSREDTCQDLQFSWGVQPVHEPEERDEWESFSRDWYRENRLQGNFLLLVQGPSPLRPEANHCLKIIEVKSPQ